MEQSRQDLDLPLDQPPRHGLPTAREHELGQRLHTRVRPVRGSESIPDVDVGQHRQLPGERRIVLLLAGIETQVLEQ